MTLNLARPYGSLYSTPRSTTVVFTFPGNSTAVFSKPEEAVVDVCSPSTRFLRGSWSLSPNLTQERILTGTCDQRVDTTMRVALPLEKLDPGFYDLQVKLVIDDGQEIEGATTIGWKVDKLPAAQKAPEGFSEFWKKVASDIRSLPLNLQVEKVQTLRGAEIDTYNRTHAGLPGNYDPKGSVVNEVEIYKVRFDSPNGGRVYGWFAKPVGDGPFPACSSFQEQAIMHARPLSSRHVMAGRRWMFRFTASQLIIRYIRRPCPSNRPHRNNHEGFTIYRNALMAVNALAALPGVNPQKLAACGGSQGGRLTVVVTALDDRIRAGVAAITHFAGIPWLRWTSQSPKTRQPATDADKTDAGFDAWYDVANFAPLVKSPMLFNAGLIDHVSPPTGIQKVYLRLPARKKSFTCPIWLTTGHLPLTAWPGSGSTTKFPNTVDDIIKTLSWRSSGRSRMSCVGYENLLTEALTFPSR